MYLIFDSALLYVQCTTNNTDANNGDGNKDANNKACDNKDGTGANNATDASDAIYAIYDAYAIDANKSFPRRLLERMLLGSARPVPP